MKRYFFSITLIALAYSAVGQEPADALRYSWYTSSGTARQQSIGGAMVSLGGDVSSTFINPGGLAFYKTGDFVITPAYQFVNTKGSYLSRTEKEKKTNFVFGTLGLVVGDTSRSGNRKVKGNAFGITINQTANFGNRILYRGINTQSSYSEKFLEELNNNGVKDSTAAFDYPFGSSLAINTFWIDTAAGWSTGPRSARSFRSLATPLLASGLIHEQEILQRGGITELTLAGATNFNDKLFAGVSLGVPFIMYKKTATFSEADATENTANNFDFASVTEDLTTEGVGLNVKAGIIYRPAEFFRLGLAVHSPQLFYLTDSYNASITTNTETFQGTLSQNSGYFTNDEDAEFKYRMLTPYRIMASAAYILREIQDVRKQKGFITADVEFVNYKAASFHTDPEGDQSISTENYLKSLNQAIDKAYKAAFNFKVGGELKFTTIMTRLGFGYYGNPYNDILGEHGDKMQLTGGLGYRNKGIFIDLAYVHTITNDVHFPYRLESGFSPMAEIKTTAGTAFLTVGFKF
jgi:hypothetical protein